MEVYCRDKSLGENQKEYNYKVSSVEWVDEYWLHSQNQSILKIIRGNISKLKFWANYEILR